MADLESVGRIIPRVLTDAQQAEWDKDGALLSARLREALPAPPHEEQSDAIDVWADKEAVLPQPAELDIRLCQIIHAIQALDLDQALAILFDLQAEVHAINRAHEPNAHPRHKA